ncbi:MAG: hypothetical protein SAMD01599839_06800 [Rectinema sp.]
MAGEPTGETFNACGGLSARLLPLFLLPQNQFSQFIAAELDDGIYPTGIKVSDEEIASLKIKRAKFHGDWNYSLHSLKG